MSTMKILLKEYRLRDNLTQRDVAEGLNIPLQSYKSYESGRRLPSVPMLVKMADFFEITIDELVGK